MTKPNEICANSSRESETGSTTTRQKPLRVRSLWSLGLLSACVFTLGLSMSAWTLLLESNSMNAYASESSPVRYGER